MINQPASLAVLAAGAMQACVRHFGVFATAALIGLAAECAIYFPLRTWTANLAADAIVQPILTTIVYVFVASDVHGDRAIALNRRWERILERAWAVVVIDFIQNLIFSQGWNNGLMTSNLAEFLLGAMVVFMFATLLFADVYAAVEPDVSPWLLVPLGFVRSIALAWQNGNIARLLFLFAFLLIANAVSNGIFLLFHLWHMPESRFWADAPVVTLTTIPLSALVALVYFDCVARERLASGSRD